MNSNNSGGIGFTGLLQIVFIVLKLIGVISWDWWIVLCPTWISIIIVIIFLIVIFIVKKKR
jgi:hypothetical protein